MKCCVIIPTVRKFQIVKDYVENARHHGFDATRLHFLLITEDFCDKAAMKKFLLDEGISGEVFGEAERLAWLRDNGIAEFSDLIPKRSHAETSFGLLWMWAHKEFEYGFFIDDDTLPHPGFDFFGQHIKNLNFEGEMDFVSSDKNWVNVLWQKFGRHRLYPRGYPYSCMSESTRIFSDRTKDVIASQGLWTNIPDLDAARILIDGDVNGQAKTLTRADDFTGNFAVAGGNFLTVCSMNLAFRREIIPAFYQLPMDDNPWKIGRFDDIWSGVILKKAADMLGKTIITGYPLCIHNKEKRSTFKDLIAEVPALELNEILWRLLSDVNSTSETWQGAARDIFDALSRSRPTAINGEFISYVGEKGLRWLECLETLPKTPNFLS